MIVGNAEVIREPFSRFVSRSRNGLRVNLNHSDEVQ